MDKRYTYVRILAGGAAGNVGHIKRHRAARADTLVAAGLAEIVPDDEAVAAIAAGSNEATPEAPPRQSSYMAKPDPDLEDDAE